MEARGRIQKLFRDCQPLQGVETTSAPATQRARRLVAASPLRDESGAPYGTVASSRT